MKKIRYNDNKLNHHTCPVPFRKVWERMESEGIVQISKKLEGMLKAHLKPPVPDAGTDQVQEKQEEDEDPKRNFINQVLDEWKVNPTNIDENGNLKKMTDAEEDEYMRQAAQHVRDVKAAKGNFITPSRGRHTRGCGSHYEAPPKKKRRTDSSSSAVRMMELETQVETQADVISTHADQITDLQTQGSKNMNVMHYFYQQLWSMNPNMPPFDPNIFGGPDPST